VEPSAESDALPRPDKEPEEEEEEEEEEINTASQRAGNEEPVREQDLQAQVCWYRAAAPSIQPVAPKVPVKCKYLNN